MIYPVSVDYPCFEGKCLCHSETFSSGISNGAEWYLVDNGMQDYNYLFSNCLEVTAELSCTKQPDAAKLQTEWDNNLDSMLRFLGSVHGGVKGRVFDEFGNIVEDAVVLVHGKDKPVKTNKRGEYWRLLLPGSYNIRASHSNKYGVLESEVADVEVRRNVGEGALTVDLFVKFSIIRTFSVSSFLCQSDQGNDEVLSFFKGCEIVKIDLETVNYVRLKETLYKVSVRIKPNELQTLCPDIEIVRPKSDCEHQALTEAISKYCLDKYCGDFGVWKIKLIE